MNTADIGKPSLAECAIFIAPFITSIMMFLLLDRPGWSVLVFFIILFFIVFYAMSKPSKIPYIGSFAAERIRAILYFSFFSITFLSSFAGSTIAENYAVQKHNDPSIRVFNVIPDALDQTGVIFFLFAFLAMIISYCIDEFAIPSLIGYYIREGQRFDPLTGAPNISLRQQTVRRLLHAIFDSDTSGSRLKISAHEIGRSFGENILATSSPTNIELFMKECGAADKKSCLLSLNVTSSFENTCIIQVKSRLFYHVRPNEPGKDFAGVAPCKIFVENYLRGAVDAFNEKEGKGNFTYAFNYLNKENEDRCTQKCTSDLICSLAFIIKRNE